VKKLTLILYLFSLSLALAMVPNMQQILKKIKAIAQAGTHTRAARNR
jgi:hypothetical protein